MLGMDLARNLKRRVLRTARSAAERTGLADPPPHKYPFRELMHVDPSVRPPYRWGTLCAAFVAKELGIPRISAIEFGVAGGNGLVELERVAQQASDASGVQIDVYGFDTGTGLTKPLDYRDLPQLWSEGDYKMDADKLRARLSRAKLVLGPVAETVPAFVAGKPAPVGFVSFDLDMYSSTMDAFKVLSADHSLLMPRVHCYFDDLIGYSHGDHNGERLAIADFNAANARRKISQIYGIRYFMGIDRVWTECMYLAHFFDHPRYNDFDGQNPLREIPLK